MKTKMPHSTQVPPAWHGAALRRALLPLNGLRTISTALVMVSDYCVTISWRMMSGLVSLWVQSRTGLLAACAAQRIQPPSL